MATSGFGRLATVLTAPGKTFESIRTKPSWALALVTLVLLSVAVNWLVSDRIDAEDFVRATLEQRNQDVPEEQIQAGIDMQENFGKLFFVVIPTVVGTLGMLVLALVCWVAFKLVGGDWDFGQALSTTLHALMPWAVATALTIPVVLGQSEITFDQVQSGSLLPSNLAFLADAEASPVTRALLASVDLFSIWTAVLLAIGASIVARIPLKTATTTTVALWLTWIVVKVGWIAIWT